MLNAREAGATRASYSPRVTIRMLHVHISEDARAMKNKDRSLTTNRFIICTQENAQPLHERQRQSISFNVWLTLLIKIVDVK